MGEKYEVSEDILGRVTVKRIKGPVEQGYQAGQSIGVGLGCLSILFSWLFSGVSRSSVSKLNLFWLWYILPFIPAANLLLVWFAPLARGFKPALLLTLVLMYGLPIIIAMGSPGGVNRLAGELQLVPGLILMAGVVALLVLYYGGLAKGRSKHIDR